MSLVPAVNGRKPRNSASGGNISQLTTLQDLHVAIASHETDKQLRGMLDSTMAHIALCLGHPPHEINIQRLLDVRTELQAHLKKSSPKRNTVRSYTNFLNILVKKARQLGWSECSSEVVTIWEPIRKAVARVHGSAGVI